MYFVVHRQLATSILDLRSDDRDSILADLDEARENVLDVQISVDSIRMQKYGGCIQYYRDGEIYVDRTCIHIDTFVLKSNAMFENL